MSSGVRFTVLAMAGSVYHMWLARRAFKVLATGDSTVDARLLSAFQAGSVAPDIGFFPGGPKLLSHRIHHESTGDFARYLLDVATTAEEEAFAAGWALHLYTDIHIHPLVNDQVALLSSNRSVVLERSDLWHKRIEWGLDCYVLERTAAPEWAVAIHMPLRQQQDCQLAETTQNYFQELADHVGICRGWKSLSRWVGRMPSIFKWAGNAKPTGHSNGARVAGAFSLPLLWLVSKALEPVRYCEDAVGLMYPLRTPLNVIEEAMMRGDTARAEFEKAWPGRFSTLENLDLDTGQPIVEST